MRGVLPLLAIALSASAVSADAASADVTVHVSTERDVLAQDGKCSLREAMTYAMGQAEPECTPDVPSGVVTISVPAGCYRIDGGLNVALPANSPVSLVAITGAGAGLDGCSGDGTVIDAKHAGSALTVNAAVSASVSGVTLTGGSPCAGVSGCSGGGVWNAGHLSLNEVTISGNAAAPGDDASPGTGATGGSGGQGGGIFNLPTGQLTVTRSTIAGNTAAAGGAGADGVGNGGGAGGTGGEGGGIFNNGGSVVVADSTVSGNTGGTGGTGGLGDPGANPATAGGDGGPGGSGGGIVTVIGLNGSGSLSLTNVTVADNAAGQGGSGAQGNPSGRAGPPGVGGGVVSTSALSLTNVTVTANLGGGLGDGVLAAGALTSELGSVIANNGSSAGAQNCTGAIANDGGNVTYPAQGASVCPGVVADPKLGALAMHGGAIATIPLGAGSAAIDAEPFVGGCPATDERGVPRPQGSACDAGAYETAPPGIGSVRATPSAGGAVTVTADVDGRLQDTSVVVHYGPSAAYGSSTRAIDAGPGAGRVSVPLAGLAADTTYHLAVVATNADGTTVSADQTVLVPASSVARGPVIRNLHQSSRRWLAGRALASIAARTGRPPVGTTFAFELSEAARVSLRFTRRLPGRLVRGRCIAPGTRTRRARRCTRIVTAGSLSFAGHPGTDRIRFSGRLSQRARLQPGGYTMTIVAVDGLRRRSSPKSLSFVIVRR